MVPRPQTRQRVVSAGGGCRLGVGSGGGGEELTRVGERAGDVGGCEQAEVTDLDEAGGQDVQQEAADELVGGKGGTLAVLGSEGDAAILEGNEALVGDADAVGVA